MTNFLPVHLLTSRQAISFFVLFTLFIFCFTSIIKAQPEFSKDNFRLLNERIYNSNSSKYKLPQDKFTAPEISHQSHNLVADSNVDSTFNASVTEGPGNVEKTVVQPDGKIIVIGAFQRANGSRVSSLVRFNTDGTLDTTFNPGTGVPPIFGIKAVALQADGKILIGGGFSSFNGQPVNGIARLNSNGSLDSTFITDSSNSYSINDILILPNGKILVSGYLGGSYLARLNANGSFDALIGNFNNYVDKIALAPDGKIVVGGEFSQPRPNVARFNTDDTLDTTFNPTTGSNGYLVNKVIVQPNGKILVAGNFSTFNGTTTDGFVRLNDNGTVDTTFRLNGQSFSYVTTDSLALQADGKILISYYYYNGTDSAFDIRRFNSDATPDNSFNTNAVNNIFASDLNILNDGSILIATGILSINNQRHFRLAKLTANGSLINTFNPSISTAGIVYAIEKQPDGKIIIAGNFYYVNGVPKNLIARLNTDGSLDNSFNPSLGLGGTIYDIIIQPNGKIIIGGAFGGGTLFPAVSFARLNSDGSLDANLNNSGSFRVNEVYSLTSQADGKILVGGESFTRGIFSVLPILRFNADGSFDDTFTTPTLQFTSSVKIRDILVQSGGKIVIGGGFSFPGNSPHQNIARLNVTGSLDAGFSATSQNEIYTLAQQSDGKIYTGSFNLSRYTSEGTPDSTFNNVNITSGLIFDIEPQSNGKVLVGGDIRISNGTAVNNIIQFNSNGSLDSTFNAGASGTVYALNTQSDGKTLVGGRFLDFNNTEKLSIVRLQNSAIRKPTPFDFDGDGKTDVSIFRPNSGEWWYYRSSDGQVPAVQFGLSTDKIVPGDYTGDGKTDIAFWRPSTGGWFIVRSENNSFFSFPFGTSGDVPVPADYDGDGKTDPAVFRPSTNTWYISLTSGGTSIFQFGTTGDVPVVGDYDGDGKADIAIFRPSNGQWWISRSTAGLAVATFGTGTDKPVPGDFTGDGKTDIAIWRPSTGEWFVLRSEDSSFFSIPFGTNGDTPVAGDYDGDGKFDFAVFRPSGSTWYINRSTAGLAIQQFGLPSDRPVPAAFVP